MKTKEEILKSRYSWLNRAAPKSIDSIYAAMDEYANQDKWISVEDHMPKQGEEVLIAIEYQAVPIQAYWNGEYWIGSSEVREWMKDGFCQDPQLAIGGIGAKVTHWQPLPKPPQS